MPDLRGADTTRGRQFHDLPAEFADEVVMRAIKFASEVPLPDSAAMRPNSNTLVSKHVEAQLTYFQYQSAKSVRVEQPWHRDAEHRPIAK